MCKEVINWSWVRRTVLLVVCLGSGFVGGFSSFALQNVTLAWSASTDTNVMGYNVYYGVEARTYTNRMDVGNALTGNISNLVEGTTYFFAVTAYNVLAMESDFSDEVSYTIPGSAGNQPPTLNVLNGLTINEDAGAQTVSLSGISSGSTNEIQTLTVTATSSYTSLIPNPTVTYTSAAATGSLALTPVANANGTATITVTVSDGQPTNGTLVRTFLVMPRSRP
jgi:hypothetical protein